VSVAFYVGDRVREQGGDAEGTVCIVPDDLTYAKWATAPDVVWVKWDATPDKAFWQFDDDLERVS
jgi:hypothetical protein